MNLVAAGGQDLDAGGRAAACSRRVPRIPELRAHPDLPDDTRLWAALQAASGGTWAGCVYDVDRIIEVIDAGLNARSRVLEVVEIGRERRARRDPGRPSRRRRR